MVPKNLFFFKSQQNASSDDSIPHQLQQNHQINFQEQMRHAVSTQVLEELNIEHVDDENAILISNAKQVHLQEVNFNRNNEQLQTVNEIFNRSSESEDNLALISNVEFSENVEQELEYPNNEQVQMFNEIISSEDEADQEMQEAQQQQQQLTEPQEAQQQQQQPTEENVCIV